MSEIEERVRRFKRALLSLQELVLRLRWLDYEVREAPPPAMAEVLDRIIYQSEVAEPTAREALIAIAFWTAGYAAERELERLRAVAFEQRYLSLQRVIRRVLPERVEGAPSEPPVPDYGTGRELSLGERRSLARRAGRTGFDRLLKDPHPMVMRTLLANPRTTEDDVVRVSALRPARAALIVEIARTHWLLRARVRMSVLQNPGSPPAVAVPLIGLCTRSELRDVARSGDVPAIVRLTAAELLALRAPATPSTPPPTPPPPPTKSSVRVRA